MRTSWKLKKLTLEQVAQSVDRYLAGDSLAEIALDYGVSRQSMHDLLKRRIRLRPSLRFGRDNHFYRGGVRSNDRAHNLVERAIETGDLRRPSACEDCGEGGRFADGRASVQAHHDDYNKPLSVRWLCQKCHHAWHKLNVATPIASSSPASEERDD